MWKVIYTTLTRNSQQHSSSSLTTEYAPTYCTNTAATSVNSSLGMERMIFCKTSDKISRVNAKTYSLSR